LSVTFNAATCKFLEVVGQVLVFVDVVFVLVFIPVLEVLVLA